jgi:uncharacterized protein YjeT (DUF2065 family)
MNDSSGVQIALAVVLVLMLLEGCVWALVPGAAQRLLDRVPTRALQAVGLVEAAVAVALLLSLFA